MTNMKAQHALFQSMIFAMKPRSHCRDCNELKTEAIKASTFKKKNTSTILNLLFSYCYYTLLLLLRSRFSRVRLCGPHRRQPTRLPHPWDSPGKNTGVGCHFLLQCMKVKSESEVAQLCLTLEHFKYTSYNRFKIT